MKKASQKANSKAQQKKRANSPMTDETSEYITASSQELSVSLKRQKSHIEEKNSRSSKKRKNSPIKGEVADNFILSTSGLKHSSLLSENSGDFRTASEVLRQQQQNPLSTGQKKIHTPAKTSKNQAIMTEYHDTMKTLAEKIGYRVDCVYKTRFMKENQKVDGAVDYYTLGIPMVLNRYGEMSLVQDYGENPSLQNLGIPWSVSFRRVWEEKQLLNEEMKNFKSQQNQ